MNYTEKYHLPQWVKSDRIMMEDFNAAMANIEGGLDGKEAHLAGLDKGLFRMAYNQLRALRGRDPQPSLPSMFYHDPIKDPVRGATALNGAQYMAMSEGTAPASSAAFFSTFETVSNMTMVAGDPNACVPLVFRFTSPVAGRIWQLFFVEYLDSYIKKPVYHLKLKNLNTGVIEWDKPVNDEGKSFGAVYVKLAIPFQANVPYHLILEQEEPVASGYVEIRLNAEGSSASFYNDLPGFTLTKTLEDFEESQGGLVVVRYRPGGMGGTITLTWNGTEVQPAATRIMPVEGEMPIYERIYIRKEPLPKKNEFSLQVQCNIDGDLSFYDWGAILF